MSEVDHVAEPGSSADQAAGERGGGPRRIDGGTGYGFL